MIVATAGHVDHGKTTLIKALTGIDTTHLPEEKTRGMTIDLGFAALKLPEGGFVGFVDVPGHERFVRNMLAGVTGIDFALLIVAADDGIMPQTREHLEILDLLGVSSGAVAITKTDRASPERVAEVANAIGAALSETTLAGAPVFRVAAPDGSGIAELRDHLIAAAGEVRRERHGSLFRLPIDRSFVVAGAGLVLTGTAASGQVAIGDQLVLMPEGRAVRVRGLHNHWNAVESVSAGERSALNIVAPDLDRDSIGRGDWLAAPGIATVSDSLDVRLAPARQVRIKDGMRVHFCHGAGSIAARLVLLQPIADADDHPLAQLVLEKPAHALARDAFILRDAAATRTLAGGHVIDPFPPKRGRRRAERIQALDALDRPDAEAALAAILPVAPDGVALDRFAQAWNLTGDEADALWARSGLARSEQRGFDPARWEQLRATMIAMAERWHKDQPDSPGPLAADLLRVESRLGRESRLAALDSLIRDHQLVREGARLRRPGHEIQFNLSEKVLWRRIAPLLGPDVRPQSMHDIANSQKLELKPVQRVLDRAASAGLVVRICPGRYLHKAAYDGYVNAAERLASESEDGLFDAASFRDRINLGRNLTIELLEHFDRIGFTRRLGDRRKVVKAASTVSQTRP
jgi:selenocysteine-specific elongation factor